MTRRELVLPAVAAIGFALTLASADDAKIRVLIIIGDDIAPFHDWRENSEALREVLVDSGKFDVRMSEDPFILESKTALARYDVIVFMLFNAHTSTMTEAGRKNLLQFVRSGKGFCVHHLASASYKDWPEFRKLCARYWVMGKSGHGPRSVFTCKIANQNHPITKGMKEFKIFEELYAKLQGDEPIAVLVEADSEWSGRSEPLVFVRTYGTGRVVHNALGHDRKAINNPGCKRLIIRGAEWAATGKVCE